MTNTLREYCSKTGRFESLDDKNSLFYIDVEIIGSQRFQIKDVKDLVADKMNFILYLSDGSEKNFSFCGCRYVGFGFMEDLNLSIHLPETLYM